MSQMTNSQWVFPSDFNFTYPSPSFLAVAISPSESTLAPNATNSVSQPVLPPPASSAAPRRVVGSPGPTLTSLSASRISKRRFNDVEGYEERSHAVVAKPVKKKKTPYDGPYSCIYCPDMIPKRYHRDFIRHQGTQKCPAPKAPRLRCPVAGCDHRDPPTRSCSLVRHLENAHGYSDKDAKSSKNSVVAAAEKLQRSNPPSSLTAPAGRSSEYTPNELASITSGSGSNFETQGFSRSETTYTEIHEPQFPGPVSQFSLHTPDLSNSWPMSFMGQTGMQQESSLSQYFGPSDLNNIFSLDDNNSFGILPSAPPMSTSPVSAGSSSRTTTPGFAEPGNTMLMGASLTPGFYGAAPDYQYQGYDYGTAHADEAMYPTQAWNGLLDYNPGFNLHTNTAEGETDYFQELFGLSVGGAGSA